MKCTPCKDVFNLIELGYNRENSKLRVKRSKERTSFSKDWSFRIKTINSEKINLNKY